jgi:general secretion pathway protein G
VEENRDLDQAFAEQAEAERRFPLWAKLAIAAGGLVLLLVVAFVVFVPVLGIKLSRATLVKAKADIMVISEAVSRYAIDNDGRWPESLETLLVPRAGGARYLDAERLPVDPWGHPYGYERPSSGAPKFRVFSLGADGRPGGEADGRDIDNLLIRDGKI